MTNAEALADFRRRYEGTYVFLNMESKGADTLVYVQKVAESSSKIGVLHLVSEQYGAMTLNIGSEGHSLKFKYPPVGVFQYGRDAYLFRRRPQRQYRRGICSDNSTLKNITQSFAGNFTEWNAKEVQAAYDHKTYSVKDALTALSDNKMRSVALADNFSVSKTLLKTPEHVVWAWNYPIARCTTTGKLTTVYEEVFKPQLEELFK